MVLKKSEGEGPLYNFMLRHACRDFRLFLSWREKRGSVLWAELILWLVWAPKHLQWWQQVGFLRTHQVTGTTHWSGLIYSVSSATLGGESSVSTLPLHHNKEWWAKSALSISQWSQIKWEMPPCFQMWDREKDKPTTKERHQLTYGLKGFS